MDQETLKNKEGSNNDYLSISTMNQLNIKEQLNQTDYIDLGPPNKRRMTDNDMIRDISHSPEKKRQSIDLHNLPKDDSYERRKESITTFPNERDALIKEDISKLYESVHQLKDKGNHAFHSNQMSQAEICYTQAIEYLNNYSFPNGFQPSNELILSFNKEKKSLMKFLQENLSMALAKQGKYYQAISTAIDIITHYDPLSESTHRRLLSWYIKINEKDKAKTLSDEIRSKFSDLSVFIPYFETLNKQEIDNDLVANPKKEAFDYTPCIVGTVGIISATIALILIATKK